LPSTIEQVQRDFGDRLAVVAINIQESRETVARWLGERKISAQVLLDPTGAAVRAYRVTSTPTAFLLDRRGRLVARAIGTKPWTGPLGRELLEKLTAP
jgi:hypothetical protein